MASDNITIEMRNVWNVRKAQMTRPSLLYDQLLFFFSLRKARNPRKSLILELRYAIQT